MIIVDTSHRTLAVQTTIPLQEYLKMAVQTCECTGNVLFWLKYLTVKVKHESKMGHTNITSRSFFAAFEDNFFNMWDFDK